MATLEQLIQAGLNVDNVVGGPAVLFIQSIYHFSSAAADGTAFPRYIQDVVDLDDGTAVTANGWSNLGYTEDGINLQRNRDVTVWDTDQQEEIKETHDRWSHEISTKLVESTLANIAIFSQGSGPTAVAGAPTAQQQLTFGSPLTIVHRRFAIFWPDSDGYAWLWAFRDVTIRQSGPATFTRTGKLGWPITVKPYPNNSISDVNDRIFRLYRTTAVATS